MTILATTRPLFMSEKDFQFALAWTIKEQYPECEIKLERHAVLYKDKNSYIDIVVEFKEKKERYSFELKYLTKKLVTTIKHEIYNLKDQSAQDLVRYDFNKDIVRLEKYKNADSSVKKGYAIILSNDSNIWTDLKRPVGYADFKIHDKENHTGTLRWNTDFVGAGTMKGREQELVLSGVYNLKWKTYSDLEIRNGIFRYLLVEII